MSKKPTYEREIELAYQFFIYEIPSGGSKRSIGHKSRQYMNLKGASPHNTIESNDVMGYSLVILNIPNTLYQCAWVWLSSNATDGTTFEREHLDETGLCITKNDLCYMSISILDDRSPYPIFGSLCTFNARWCWVKSTRYMVTLQNCFRLFHSRERRFIAYTVRIANIYENAQMSVFPFTCGWICLYKKSWI